MIEHSQCHLSTDRDILAHTNECNTDNSECLESVILLVILLRLVDVVVAVMKHGLDFHYVASPRVRADFHEDLRLFRNGMFDGFQGLQCGLGRILSA